MTNQMNTLPPAPLFRDSYESSYLIERLSTALYSTLLNKPSIYDIIVVCIGTDRSTGDALGPLIGTKLQELKPNGIYIYGTIDHPVHAMNLAETLISIKQKHPKPYILAIDACLGDLKSVGHITLGDGALKPGAGVQKNLPEVGHLHITGIVNVGGFMEYFVLQNTRLSIVMNMADKIAKAIYHTTLKFEPNKEPPKKEAVRYTIQSQNSQSWI